MEGLDSPLYNDILTLLGLIRSREVEFFQMVWSSQCPETGEQLYPQDSKYSLKIQTLVNLHQKEAGQLVVKFWLTLRKIMKMFLQKIRTVNLGGVILINVYSSIVKTIKKLITNNSSLGRFSDVEVLIKKKYQCLTLRGTSLENHSLSPGNKSKTLTVLFNRKKKSCSNILVKAARSKPAKRDASPDPGKQRRKQQKQQKRLVQLTNKMNFKLYKDLNLHAPLQKYDHSQDKKYNSAVIFGDLLARNQTIHKVITKFQSQSINRSCQSQKERNRYHLSIGKQCNPQTACKTLRRSQIQSRHKKHLASPGLFPTVNHQNPGSKRPDRQKSQRPLTSKTIHSRTQKLSLPLIQKPRRNVLSAKVKQNKPH